MERAVREVTENNKSTRCVDKDLGLSRATLARYVADSRKSEDGPEISYKKIQVSPLVFTLDEEQILVDYIIRCSKMFHGRSVVATRKLAWEYAKQTNKNYSPRWDERGTLGLNGFMG